MPASLYISFWTISRVSKSPIASSPWDRTYLPSLVPGDRTSAPVAMFHRDSIDVLLFSSKLAEIPHLNTANTIGAADNSIGHVLLNGWRVTSVEMEASFEVKCRSIT